MFETHPDFLLPEAVEAFDGRLEARLVGDGKHRGHAETEAQADDAPHAVAVLSGAGESIVVVELRVAGESEGAPVLDEAVDRSAGSEGLFHPDAAEAAMQGISRENRQMRASANRQPLDRVELVEFGAALGDRGQIPAARRRRATHSPAPIQDAGPPQDASDGAFAGARPNAAPPHLAQDRRGPALAQRASLLEPTPQPKHLGFEGRLGATRVSGRMRTVGPIDTVETLALRPPQPALDGAQGDPETPGDRPLRGPLANGGDDLATLAVGELFVSWEPRCVVSHRYGRQGPPYASPPAGRGGLVAWRNSSRATPSFRSARPPTQVITLYK